MVIWIFFVDAEGWYWCRMVNECCVYLWNVLMQHVSTGWREKNIKAFSFREDYVKISTNLIIRIRRKIQKQKENKVGMKKYSFTIFSPKHNVGRIIK